MQSLLSSITTAASRRGSLGQIYSLYVKRRSHITVRILSQNFGRGNFKKSTPVKKN
jgi:hypothetical protein